MLASIISLVCFIAAPVLGNSGDSTVSPAPGISLLAGNLGGIGNLDGVGSEARFSGPLGIAVDEAGYVYVADTDNSLIRKIAPDGKVTTLVGHVAIPGVKDPAGNQEYFSYPREMAIDAAGNLYVTEGYYNGICKVTPDGMIKQFPFGAPIPGVSGNIGAREFLTRTERKVVDGAGNSYEIKFLTGALSKTTPSGETAILAGAQKEFGTTDGVGEKARFGQITHLAADKEGNIYVSDAMEGIIRKVTPEGKVSTIAGKPTERGFADGRGAHASFNGPGSVVADGDGNVYVTDYPKYQVGSIRRIKQDGTVTTLISESLRQEWVIEGGERVARDEKRYLAIDAIGNVYVSYSLGNTIMKISPSGVSKVFVGTPDAHGLGHAVGTAAKLNKPSGLTVDRQGNVFVSDTGNCAIRKITSDGIASTLAGRADQCQSIDGTL